MPNREKLLRPDPKGRVTLGKYAEGVSSYSVKEKGDGVLELSPHVEIPAREAWLFKNPRALAAVKQGLKESGDGKGKIMSFAKYADETED